MQAARRRRLGGLAGAEPAHATAERAGAAADAETPREDAMHWTRRDDKSRPRMDWSEPVSLTTAGDDHTTGNQAGSKCADRWSLTADHSDHWPLAAGRSASGYSPHVLPGNTRHGAARPRHARDAQHSRHANTARWERRVWHRALHVPRHRGVPHSQFNTDAIAASQSSIPQQSEMHWSRRLHTGMHALEVEQC